jgi:hypothetical protein
LILKDDSTSLAISPLPLPTSLSSKKRPSTSYSLSPSKKGHGSSPEDVVPLVPPHTNSPFFSQGSTKSSFAHALFKVARSGKKTMPLAMVAAAIESIPKGDCYQSPQPL